MTHSIDLTLITQLLNSPEESRVKSRDLYQAFSQICTAQHDIFKKENSLWSHLKKTLPLSWLHNQPHYLEFPHTLFTKEQGKRKCINKKQALHLLQSYLQIYATDLLQNSLIEIKNKHWSAENPGYQVTHDLVHFLKIDQNLSTKIHLENQMKQYQDALQNNKSSHIPSGRRAA